VNVFNSEDYAPQECSLSRRRWDSWLLTGMRSAYFCLMRSASALRFSNGCSSLNLERMLAVFVVVAG
jgi:hypothetical protein